MLSYCLKCRKYTESKIPKVVKTKNGKIMVSFNCVVCGSKKLRFIKEQEVSRSLLGNNSPFKGVPLLGAIF